MFNTSDLAVCSVAGSHFGGRLALRWREELVSHYGVAKVPASLPYLGSIRALANSEGREGNRINEEGQCERGKVRRAEVIRPGV